MANLHVTLIRRRPDSRVPILKSKHLCTSGGAQPWPQHPFLPSTFIHLHHVCNPRLQKQLDPLFDDADQSGPTFSFSLYHLDCLGSPTLSLPPSLAGIRVNRVYGMERMVNMEEGFESVWRCLEEYTYAQIRNIFSSFIFAPLMPLVYCYRTGS